MQDLELSHSRYIKDTYVAREEMEKNLGMWRGRWRGSEGGGEEVN